LVSVPYNGFGYQLPLNGNAYCGFHTYWPANEHEFVGCRLNHPLEIGQQYYIEFNICSGSGGEFLPGVFTNNLGARLSMDSFSTNLPVAINNFAHVNYSSVITDTIIWIKVSGYFIADSTYKYIAFGNFFTNAMTDTIAFIASAGSSYYYIDDACVATNSKDCPASYNAIFDGWNESEFFLFPNPANDVLRIKMPNKIVRNLEVRNEMNFTIIEKQVSPNNSYFNLNVTELPNGIYMLTLHGIEKDFTGKFLVIHH
ncbi:MAG: T9SS type A sorting domain-containing protein, partial [Chitinophagales bacterium]|nr:T9SS type A sorting domain-containing protein [Chitinophagales bacterium]